MKKVVYKQLTFDGVNDLYQHPLYGARTLENIAYMDHVAAHPPAKPKQVWWDTHVDCSMELYMLHEQCIEENGFGLFGD